MKRTSTIFLQIVVILIAIGALVFMLGEPHLEGRNAGATLSEIYFNDPFLACAYVASIAFFVALYQAFKAFGYVRRNETSSPQTLKALRTIRYCMMVLIGFIAAAEAYLFIARPGDDIAGGVFMGLLMTFVFALVAAVAARFEKAVRGKM